MEKISNLFTALFVRSQIGERTKSNLDTNLVLLLRSSLLMKTAECRNPNMFDTKNRDVKSKNHVPTSPTKKIWIPYPFLHSLYLELDIFGWIFIPFKQNLPSWFPRLVRVIHPSTLHRFLRFLDDLLRVLDWPVILSVEKCCWSPRKNVNNKIRNVFFKGSQKKQHQNFLTANIS